MKLDLHIHSRHSYDSFSDPGKILRVARKRGLDAISITDHDTMGAYRQLRQDGEEGVLLVPGMEVKTDMGDIIGLFLRSEIAHRRFEDVVGEIRSQGGIVVLPHPYRRRCDPASLAAEADLVEVINARSRGAENSRAWRLCGSCGKKAVTGSDAHTYMEIGRVVTEIEGSCSSLGELREALLRNGRSCYGKVSPFYLSHGLSLLSARVKRMGGMA
jgi:hypothetical protein